VKPIALSEGEDGDIGMAALFKTVVEEVARKG
jgi:hypothetical protein